MLTIGSLFSGIGGLELGLERAGLGPVLWQCEIDPFCRRVLSRHWPNVERLEDVHSAGASVLEPVDLICGGFPCQDVSSAGKGKGLAGKRSGLWREFARVAGELKPRWVVVENVASGATRWVDAVSGELEQLGYEVLPLPVSAFDVGAPHMRRRVFLVAHAGGCRRGARGKETAEGGSQRQGLADHRGTRVASDRDREPTIPSHGEVAGVQGVAADSPEWSTAPDIRGVANGLPNRVDRLRALGNGVVPECAMVVGWVIRELTTAREAGK